MLGGGYALRLSFETALSGACMRCLKPASPRVAVSAREVDRPGHGEELESPYVHDETLDLAAWARDAFVLTAPLKVLCREDCAGLCPVCAADLNEAPPGTGPRNPRGRAPRSEEHTSELQSRRDIVCGLLLEKKNDCICLARRTIFLFQCRSLWISFTCAIFSLSPKLDALAVRLTVSEFRSCVFLNRCELWSR